MVRLRLKCGEMLGLKMFDRIWDNMGKMMGSEAQGLYSSVR
jgi:hypothetical protein